MAGEIRALFPLSGKAAPESPGGNRGVIRKRRQKAGGNQGEISQRTGEIRAKLRERALSRQNARGKSGRKVSPRDQVGGNRRVIQPKVGGNRGVIPTQSMRKALSPRSLPTSLHPLSLSLSLLSTNSNTSPLKSLATARIKPLNAAAPLRCASAAAKCC